MDRYVEKYADMIENELFKATYDEAIEFCDRLIDHLAIVRGEYRNMKMEFEEYLNAKMEYKE